MPIAVWLAVKDINTEIHETLDSITTYQGEGPPGRRRVTLQVRDRHGAGVIGWHYCGGMR